MVLLSFLLNLPWTIIGLLEGLLSLPYKFKFSNKPLSIILYVKSFWWRTWLPGKKGIRGSTQGHVVLLGPTADDKDLAHELIHVQQFQRTPFVQPLLYLYQNLRRGYRQNKYEQEAYTKSASRYI